MARSLGTIWLALFALVPTLVLAWPGARGAVDQLQPELWGAGVVGLGALAAVAAVVLGRQPVAVSGLTLLLGFVAFGTVTQQWNVPTDTLEASRSMLLSLSALALLIVGARLDAPGRAALVRATVLVSIAFVVPALFGVQGRLFGTLGNTGWTAQAALPGALAGAVLFAAGRGAWRVIGMVAAVLCAAYVTVAPAYAAVIAMVVALAVGIVRSRRRRVGLALVLAACAVSGQVARWIDAMPARGGSGGISAVAQTGGGGDLGGVEVRRRVWSSSLKMLADHPWLGTGPGQFRASFPPYRDATERALSDRSSGFETEVEHAHNDWLQGLLDAGLLGGCLWILFLLVCARAAWRSLGSEDDGDDEHDNDRAALGAGTLGLLVAAAAHAPLTSNPASSGLFFLFAGALATRPERAVTALRSRAAMTLLAALLLAAQAPRALAFLRYGDLMRLQPTEEAPGHRLPERDRVARALRACPDAPLALGMLARDPATDDPTPYWERLVELRPDNFEALVRLGGRRADESLHDAARTLWTRAHELEPERPNVMRNLALLEARAWNESASHAWLDRLEQVSDDTDGWLRRTAVDELFRGLGVSAQILFARFDPQRLEGPAEKLYAEARELGESNDPDDELLGAALECRAHVMWAREHAAVESFDAAVRSYRQALRLSSRQQPGGAPRLRLEHAAALLRDGQEEAGRTELEAAAAGRGDYLRLPEWALEALEEAGL